MINMQNGFAKLHSIQTIVNFTIREVDVMAAMAAQTLRSRHRSRYLTGLSASITSYYLPHSWSWTTRWLQDKQRMLKRLDDNVLIDAWYWRWSIAAISQCRFWLNRIRKHASTVAHSPFLNPIRFNLSSIQSFTYQGKKVIPNGFVRLKQLIDDVVLFIPPGRCLPNLRFVQVLKASFIVPHSNIERQSSRIAKCVNVIKLLRVEAKGLSRIQIQQGSQWLCIARNWICAFPVPPNSVKSTAMRTTPWRPYVPIRVGWNNRVFTMRAMHGFAR